MTMNTVTPAGKARFWAMVDKQSPTGCWLWTGPQDPRGYGRFWFEQKPSRAHRRSYEWLVGPIPEGLVLDHLCRVRNCVRPDHLEPVTNRENILRGVSPTARNAVKTHCSQGHPYDSSNTYVRPGGGRDCRACKRNIMRAQRQQAVTS